MGGTPPTSGSVASGFIGRAAERAQLGRLLDRAAAGETQVAVIAGPAGIGKSSLLGEFVRETESRVLLGSCLPLGERGVPFGPVLEMLRSLETEPEVRGVLPHGLIAPSPRHHDAIEPASRTHLFQEILDLFARLAADSTTVIVLEDLHWADRSTRDLFAFLLPNLRSERLLILVSYRTDDVHRDHPLRPVLAELQRNPRVTYLDLDPFSAEEAAEQIAQLTGERPSNRSLERIVQRTQGNPYFISELVAAHGADVDRTTDALPESLRELLLVRADVVSPAARRTLRVMSVTDGPVAESMLAGVAGVTIDEVRAHLRESVDKRLMEVSPIGARFAHALLREALDGDLLPGERTEFHASFATAIVAELDRDSGDRAGLLARLAHHRAAAGDVVGALESWRQAATAAKEIFAFAEAHHHLTQVLVHRSPAEPASGDYVQLLARAAEMAFLGGDAEAARQLAREAIAQLDPEVDPLLAGVLHERLARYVRDTDEHDQALELVERALELVPDDPPSVEHARVLAGLAGQLMVHGRYAEARSHAVQARDEARQVGSTVAESDALNTIGVVASLLDGIDVGIEAFDEARRLAERCGDAHQQMRAAWNTMACLFDAGEWERGLRAQADAVALMPRLGQDHLLPDLGLVAADMLMRLGRWDDAAQRAAEWGLAPLDLLVERGDFGDARRLIEERTARNVFIDQEQEGWPLVNLATLETWEGNHEAARRAVDAALGVTADLDSPIATAYALATGCRCEADAGEEARRRGSTDDEQQAVARCSDLGDRIGELLGRPGPADGWKREVGALALQCRGEVARAADGADPDVWAEATAVWDRMAMPYHAAYTRFRAGEALFASTGDRTAPEAPLRSAHRVAGDLGARPLRELIESFARRARIDIGVATGAGDDFGLTDREREVLTVLSTGATNRRIAADLFISEKTASVHVSNIIRKLGVSNRGEAAALAHRKGLVP